jgi:rhodanese-related sulfurtransferase
MKGRDHVYTFAFCSLLTWSITGCSTETPTPTVTVEKLHTIAESGRDIYVLDVRTQAEFHKGHLPFADDLISYTAIEQNLDRLPQDKNAEIYVFCRIGRRSKITTDFLISRGYTNVHNVEGGIIAWQNSGYDVAVGPK